MHNLEFVVAGYSLTALALGTYVLSLLARARRARDRAVAVASRRGRPRST
jgi:hypothetical protein